MRLIIDTSVAIAWVARQQSTPMCESASISAVEHGALVPFHFYLELTNVLLALERRRRLSVGDVDSSLTLYDSLDIEIDNADFADTRSATFALARRYQLTTFDAAYIEIALRTGRPLATRDQALADAARNSGAQLFVG